VDARACERLDQVVPVAAGQSPDVSARPGRDAPAACAETEDDAGDDSQQPAEHGARDDDPDERGVAATDHPAEFHLARIGDHQSDQDDEERHETERQGVETRAVAVSPKPRSAQLDRFRLRRWLPGP